MGSFFCSLCPAILVFRFIEEPAVKLAKADNWTVSSLPALVMSTFTGVASAIAALVLYLGPNYLEMILVRKWGPWIACVVLGDLCGCVILFILGHRRCSIFLYLTATAAEAVLFSNHFLSTKFLLWATNLAPAALCGYFFYRSVRASYMVPTALKSGNMLRWSGTDCYAVGTHDSIAPS